MTRWTPDPTFYPSPRLAAKAPAETLAYVAAFAPKRDVPDSIAVVDVDPASPTYSKIVGGIDMPKTGDELHHYGWNACSSCLCPNAPHPHTERRYLVVPGLRSSRIYIIDTKPDPKNPMIVRVIEPEEVIEATGYSRPHTVHCGPDGIYVSALGRRARRCAGRRVPHGSGDLRRAGALGGRSRPAASRLRFLVAPRLRHRGDERMGRAEHIENGLVPEILLGAQYGRRLHFWDLQKRKHLQEIDFGPDYQLVFELRPAHDPTKAYGFVNCVISLKDLSASIWTWYRDGDRWAVKKIIEISRRARRSRPPAAGAERLQGGAAARHRYRPVDGRPLPLCRLLGYGRSPPI